MSEGAWQEVERALTARDLVVFVAVVRSRKDDLPAGEVASLLHPEFDVEVITRMQDVAELGDALFELGAELWNHSDTVLAAIDAFRDGAEHGSRPALEAVGESLAWMGAYEQAIPYLDRTRSTGVGRPAWIAGLLGHARFELGDDSDDVEELLREGALQHTDFGVDLATLLYRHEAFEEALPLLRDLVAQNVPGSHIILGNVLEDPLDDYAGAIEAYLGGIEEGDSHSAYNLAILYRNRDAPELADHYRKLARTMGDLTRWPDED
jgi:tetratricopeptide (TPR) repeat protein